MLEQLFAKLLEEAAVIKQAPFSFILVFGTGLLIMYFLFKRSYQGRLDELRAWLADRDNVITFLEKKQTLKEASPGETKIFSPPVIELMHIDFEDVVQDENGFYFRVAKGQGFKAAILDFSLKPISGAVPWTEVQPQIRFKDSDDHITRISDAIWLGHKTSKIPLKHGVTGSLVLAIHAPKRDFRTYELQSHTTRPLERKLSGEIIRAEVRLIGEYMDDPRADVSKYFELIKEDTPRIVEITGEQFNNT